MKSNILVLGVVLGLVVVVGSAIKINMMLNSTNNKATEVSTVAFGATNTSMSNSVNSKSVLIKKLTLNADQVVVLSGVIDENVLSVVDELALKIRASENSFNPKPIYLLISSPGGSILEGSAVINVMETSRVPINTVCLDICASMAAVIHQHGTNRLMVNRSILMFHDAAGSFQGYFPHIKSKFTTVEKYVQRFNSYISARTKMPLEELVTAEHKELWIDAIDSLDKNFTDGIVSVQVFKDSTMFQLKDLITKDKTKLKAVPSPNSNFEMVW